MPEYSGWVWGDFLATLEMHRASLGLLAAAILLGLIGQPLLWRYGIWKGLRENRDQYRDLQVTFGDDGIHFTWPNATLHNDWAFYQTVIESREFFLLVYGGLYVAFPKRAVADVPALADTAYGNTFPLTSIASAGMRSPSAGSGVPAGDEAVRSREVVEAVFFQVLAGDQAAEPPPHRVEQLQGGHKRLR